MTLGMRRQRCLVPNPISRYRLHNHQEMKSSIEVDCLAINVFQSFLRYSQTMMDARDLS
jgi:hypothetical protein